MVIILSLLILLFGLEFIECSKNTKDGGSVVVAAVASIVFFLVVLVIIIIIVVLVLRRKKMKSQVISLQGGQTGQTPIGMISAPPGSIVVNNPNQLYPPSINGWQNLGYGPNFIPSNAYVGQFQVHQPPPTIAATVEIKSKKMEEQISTQAILTKRKSLLPDEDTLTLIECVDLESLAGSEYKAQLSPTTKTKSNTPAKDKLTH